MKEAFKKAWKKKLMECKSGHELLRLYRRALKEITDVDTLEFIGELVDERIFELPDY